MKSKTVSFGFTILLRNQEAVARYREYHRNAWPEIIGQGGALEKIGVTKMRIFFMKPRTLFMYVEGVAGFNPVTDFARALTLNPRVKEWDDIMHNQLLERIKENEGPLQWALMEDILHYE
jgi:L-rhamnose mutarotase